MKRINTYKMLLVILFLADWCLSLWGTEGELWPLIANGLVGGGAFGGAALLLIQKERHSGFRRWVLGGGILAAVGIALGGGVYLRPWLVLLWPLLLGGGIWFLRMRMWGGFPSSPLYYGFAFALMALIKSLGGGSSAEKTLQILILTVLTVLIRFRVQSIPWKLMDRLVDLFSGLVFVAAAVLLAWDCAPRWNTLAETADGWLLAVRGLLLIGMIPLLRVLAKPCSNLTLQGCLVKSAAGCIPVRCALILLAEAVLPGGTGVEWLGMDLATMMVLLTCGGKQDCAIFMNNVLTGLDALVTEKGKLV